MIRKTIFEAGRALRETGHALHKVGMVASGSELPNYRCACAPTAALRHHRPPPSRGLRCSITTPARTPFACARASLSAVLTRANLLAHEKSRAESS